MIWEFNDLPFRAARARKTSLRWRGNLIMNRVIGCFVVGASNWLLAS
jgi:hypothetical protein